MTEMCGEIADGMLGHAFTTKRYLDEVTIPTMLRGIRRSGRDRRDFQLVCPVFVVTGEKETELAAAAATTRKQIAFYGSTPAYRKVLEMHGWGDLQHELHRLSVRGDWDAMGSLIDDEILDAFAVVARLTAWPRNFVIAATARSTVSWWASRRACRRPHQRAGWPPSCVSCVRRKGDL
jgi:probable F420-dependent oxidoreductase